MVNSSQTGTVFPLNDIFLDAYKEIKGSMHQDYLY